MEDAIAEVCRFRGWELVIVNCRGNHVHVAVKCGNVPADKAMNQFKAYATRWLREAGYFLDVRVWTRGGSTRHLNTERSLAAAFSYVKHQ